MRAGSLFSGIGGADLGFERAGIDIAFQCEKDPQAQRVLREHWPNVPLFTDVQELQGDHLRADGLLPVDILVGGFPCQDISVAGGRAGLAGSRSGLFFEFARLIEEVRPKWVVIENVPGLLSSNAGRDLGTVLGTLGELGLGWAYRVLDAQFFGLAQRRQRVFIVGCAGDQRRAGQVLLEPEGGSGDPPPRRPPGSFVTTCLTDGLGSGGPDAAHAQAGWLVPDIVSQAISSKWAKQSSGPAGDEHHNLLPVPFRKSRRAQSQEHPESWQQDDVTNTLNAFDNASEGHATQLIAEPSWGVRRLTPRECERLQGFPDDWTFASDGARYRQIGNAIAVPVSEWLGRRLVAMENGAIPDTDMTSFQANIPEEFFS